MNAFELKSNPMLMIEVVSSCSAKCITKSNLRGIFFLVPTYLFGKIKSTLLKNVILQKLFSHVVRCLIFGQSLVLLSFFRKKFFLGYVFVKEE